MGQSTSKTNQRGKLVSKKNNQYHGSTIFGYTMYHKKTSIYKSDSDKGDDNILFKPFLYGLENNSSQYSLLHDQQESNSRTDSGFLLYEKNSRLWKDLMYIDQTYYNELPTTTTTTTTTTTNTKMVQKSSLNIKASTTTMAGDALYFNDIAAMCLSMYDLDLSKRGIGSISPNIGLLSMVRKLDLSFNYLSELPEEIGYLTQLEQLSVSHNSITFIPDTICHLSRLTEFNISHNQLMELTPFIRHLDKLQSLILGHNQLKEINAGAIRNINSNLALLDLSYNPITILPAEITQLPFLRRLRLEGCPLTNSLDKFSTVHNSPSLLEICARKIILQKQQQQELKSILPDQLFNYINNYKVCSHCHGPYFDSFLSRGRWIDRNDVWIPLEYRLCSAHWSDENDRTLSMFSTNYSYNDTLSVAPIHPLPITETLPAKAIRKSTITRRSRLRKWNRRASNTTITEMSPSSSSSSFTASTILVSSEENELIENQPDQVLLTSIVKKWKYKMKNNSTLFFKKS